MPSRFAKGLKIGLLSALRDGIAALAWAVPIIGASEWLEIVGIGVISIGGYMVLTRR